MTRQTIIFFLLPIWFTGSGCSEGFEPLQNNEKYHFSVYGFLDATADTQWIRVMPVRDDIFFEPKPIDATVSLEHVETGETVILKDSLFEFSHNTFAYNFWTTANIEAEQTYLLTVENSKEYSEAEVTLPADFPTPLVRIERRSSRDPTPIRATVDIQGIDQLADVLTIYQTTDRKGRIFLSHLQDSIRAASGMLQINMDPQEDFSPLEAYLTLPSGVNRVNFLDTPEIVQQIYIASAGPDYHFFPSIDEKVIALPEGPSNIINGVGYLAGIISKTFPYESCFEEEQTVLISCETEPNPWTGNIPTQKFSLVR